MLKLATDAEADKALAASAGERYSTDPLKDASDGRRRIAPPWSSLTAYDLNQGRYPVEDPAGRCAGAGGEGDKGNDLTTRRSVRWYGGRIISRAAGSQGERAGCRQWAHAMGATRSSGAGGCRRCMMVRADNT